MLQACETVDAVANLITSINSWKDLFDGKKEILEFLTSHDWQGDCFPIERKMFAEECFEVLKSEDLK